MSGERRPVYVTAVFTGLRRSELDEVQWDDVHLDAAKPFLNARGSTTKNHKQAIIGLHPDVVGELRALRAKVKPKGMDFVFRDLLPDMDTFRADLKAAGIPYVNEKGQYADFHSLRHTLGTNLALAGIAPRVAMEVMRHSDIRLTTKTYTDEGLLPVTDAVVNLPSVLTPAKGDSQIDSQNLFREGQSLSVPVTNLTNGNKSKGVENQQLVPFVSVSVTTGQDNEEWCAIQGSNTLILLCS